MRLVICTVMLSAAVLLSSCSAKAPATGKLPELPVKYETDEAAAQAERLLFAGQAPAELLTDAGTARKLVFLTFNGMASPKTTRALLDLLDRYKIKATFFLPGVASAEDPDAAAEIARRGHEIGNYTMWGETEMQTLSAGELADNFARSQTVLREITGYVPTLLVCRATEYTDTVLRAAGAAGAAYALESHRFLSYQSFRDLDQVRGYVRGLERGAVVSVNVDSVLNEAEYSAPRQAEESSRQPAAEPEPVVYATDSSAPEMIDPTARAAAREARLLAVVNDLLQELALEDFTVLPASDIPKYDDPDFSLDFGTP